MTCRSSTMIRSLPDEILPECWSDNIRMDVLFAPIRPKSANPQDWEAKYKFWKSLIGTYCTHCGVVSFTLPELRKLFKKGARSPSCLNVVVEEMSKCGDCVDMDAFMQKNPDTWGRWAVNKFVKVPFMWGFNALTRSVKSSEEVCYVHVETVKSEAQKLLASIPEERKNRVLSLEELFEITGYSLEKINEVRILLNFLVKEGKGQLREVQHEGEGETLKSVLLKLGDKKVKPFTNVEVGIHTLEQNEKLLEKNVEKLENEIFRIREEAKQHLLKGRRQMAKNCLRKKHEVEKFLTKRDNALHNVQILLSRVKHAETDGEVLASYNLALSSLKDTFKSAGLTEESVSKTMLELGEVLEIHDDIQASLAQPVTDESDVEEELAELLASDEPVSENGPAPHDASAGNEALQDLEERLEKLDLPDVPKMSVQKNKISL